MINTSTKQVEYNDKLIDHIEDEIKKVELQIKRSNDFHQVKIYERDILIKNRLISDLKKENIALDI